MTATEGLRRLLGERGVEYEGGERSVRWRDRNGVMMQAFPLANGELGMGVWSCTPAQAVEATLGREVTGETSDGYHTFNELYHHRAVLFSVIVRDHRELAWKSKAHHDGTMYDGMFIVGIETPKGQATYHYDIDPYWGIFDCRELERAPEWDGHTPDEAIERIASLGRGTCHDTEGSGRDFCCSECGARLYVDTGDTYTMIAADEHTIIKRPNFCPNCGAEVTDG